MATCKECLYYCKCYSVGVCYTERYINEVSTTGNVKDLCEDFTPKSNYVKRERERGEWVKHKPDPKVMDEFHKMGIGKAMNRNSIYWTCSCCGTWGTPIHKFCSECGAEMRKEDNNG